MVIIMYWLLLRWPLNKPLVIKKEQIAEVSSLFSISYEPLVYKCLVVAGHQVNNIDLYHGCLR